MQTIQNRLVTIYSSDDVANDYASQGLGSLPDFISCSVNSKLNGGEFFTGVYPNDGINSDKIQNDNIIYTYVDGQRSRQRMRIYNTNTQIIEGMITFNAEPIFSDTRRYVGKYFSTGDNPTTAQAAFNQVKNILKPQLPSRFKFVSDVDTQSRVEIEQFNLLEFFAGKEGSILDRFKGEFIRDNNTLYHTKRLGVDNKLQLTYSKNLNELELEIDSSQVLLGVYPFISGDQDEPDITLPEEVIMTDTANLYPNGYIEFVDFKEKAEDVDGLRREARNWLLTNADKTKPVISGKIDMVSLRDVEEYKEFSKLTDFTLGDGVNVYHPDLNDIINARIVEYDYNVLTGSYDSVVIGNLKSSFLDKASNLSGEIISNITRQIDSSTGVGASINSVIMRQINKATGQSGGFVVIDPPENPTRILIMDSPNKQTAQTIRQINYDGFAKSTTGIDGDYFIEWGIESGFHDKIDNGESTNNVVIDNGTITYTYDKLSFNKVADDKITFYNLLGTESMYLSRRESMMLDVNQTDNFSLATQDTPTGKTFTTRFKVSGSNGDVRVNKVLFGKDRLTVDSGTKVDYWSDINMNGYKILNQSDIRLKENILPVEINGINETKKLEFYEFDRKQMYKNKNSNEQPNSERELGLIAQYTPFLSRKDNDSNYLSIDVNKQIMLNSLTNKQLIERIEALESKVVKRTISRRKYHHNR